MNKRTIFKRADERGNVTIFAMASIVSIMLIIVLTVGASSVFTTKAKIDNDLDLAIEQTHLSGYTLELRNVDDPYTMLANTLLKSLRQSGFSGDVDIYTYECSDAEINAKRAGLADNVRVIVYQINLEQKSDGLVEGGKPFDNIGVTTVKCSSITPYSGIKIFKPAGRSSTCLHYSAPANKNSFSSSDGVSLIDLPKALSKYRNYSLEKVVDALDE